MKYLCINKLCVNVIFSLLTLLQVGVGNVLHAQSVEKGFKAFSVHNYFKAKEIFEKKLKNDPIGASCGLSYIYSTNNNPFYQLDSARKYILRAEMNFPGTSKKTREQLALLPVDSILIQVQKSKVARLAFEETKLLNSLRAYERYIFEYPFASELEEAIEARNEMAFAAVREENIAIGYHNFMQNYPDAKQYNEARRRFDKTLYLEQTEKGDITSYVNFIRYYSDNPYVLEAMDRVYEMAITKNSIDAYAKFIKKYPNNKNVSKAWRILYALYMKDYSQERMAEFRLDYPNYPFKNELMKDFSLSFKWFYPIRNEGKWGFIDKDGTTLIAPKYDWVTQYKEGLAVVSKNRKQGYVDKLGNEKIPLQYEDAEPFIEGHAIVMKDGKYGVINKANLIQIPFMYDEIGEFNEGVAYVSINGKYGFIDISNQMVVDPIYDGCGDFNKGHAYVEKNGKYGIIDRKGEIVVPIEFDWLENFKNGMARVKKGSQFGLYSEFGVAVVPIRYDNMGIYSNGLCMVSIGDLFGYLDMEGKEAIPLQYEFELAALNWAQFKDGYAKIKIKGKCGIIDSTGKRLLPAIFEDIGYYTPSLIAVKKRGLWGFSDHEARLKIPYRYEFAWGFQSDSLSKVRKDGKMGYINWEGNEEIFVVYDEVSDIVNNRVKVMQGTTYGLIDRNNNVVIPIEYDELKFEKELVWVKKNDRIRYINPVDGIVVWAESLPE